MTVDQIRKATDEEILEAKVIEGKLRRDSAGRIRQNDVRISMAILLDAVEDLTPTALGVVLQAWVAAVESMLTPAEARTIAEQLAADAGVDREGRMIRATVSGLYRQTQRTDGEERYLQTCINKTRAIAKKGEAEGAEAGDNNPPPADDNPPPHDDKDAPPVRAGHPENITADDWEH